MGRYVEADELAAFLRIEDSAEHVHLQALCDTASAAVDAYCGQTFDEASGSTSARVFAPVREDRISVDPFANDTGLAVATDTNGDGTYNQSWASTDWQLEPLNQRHAGLSDHAYNLIRAIESLKFPLWGKRATVQVTADWGWTTVPAPVLDATLMHAARLHERRNMPAGIVAGDGFIGRSSLGIDPDVKMLLNPFVRADKWT